MNNCLFKRALVLVVINISLLCLSMAGCTGKSISPSNSSLTKHVTISATQQQFPNQRTDVSTKGWSSLWNFDYVIWDIWGSSPSDVFAVGQYGKILHYDCQTWKEMKSGTNEKLMGIWGSSSQDVFVAGFNGTILHYDGKIWRKMQSGTSVHLGTVWGSSPNNVFVTGWEGIWHYDGLTWEILSTDENIGGDIWGTSSGDMFFLGTDSILHYNGAAWRKISIPEGKDTLSLTGIWGSSNQDIFVICNKSIIQHYDGQGWTAMNVGITWDYDYLSDVWGTSSKNVYAVGSSGLLFNYDGQAWKKMDSGTEYSLHGMWGSTNSDIFVVGARSGKGIILHYAGD